MEIKNIYLKGIIYKLVKTIGKIIIPVNKNKNWI